MDVRGMVIIVHHLAQQHLIGVFDSCRSPVRTTLAVLYSFCYISICWLAEPLPADTNAAGRLCLFLSELQQGLAGAQAAAWPLHCVVTTVQASSNCWDEERTEFLVERRVRKEHSSSQSLWLEAPKLHGNAHIGKTQPPKGTAHTQPCIMASIQNSMDRTTNEMHCAFYRQCLCNAHDDDCILLSPSKGDSYPNQKTEFKSGKAAAPAALQPGTGTPNKQ